MILSTNSRKFDKRICVSLDAETFAELEKMSQKMGITKSALVRQLIMSGFDKWWCKK